MSTTSGDAPPRERLPLRRSPASRVENPPARRTSRASFRFASLSSTMSTSERSPPVVSSRRMPIRLVLADDQYLVREGIRRLLELQDDLEILADVRGPRLAPPCRRRRAAGRRRHGHPHAARQQRRGDPGSDAAARARPEVGVVVLSQYATPSYALALLEGGSEGRAYLLKERVKDVDQLVAAIRDRRRRRLGHRPEGGRGARRRERPRRGVAAQPADAARARRAAGDGRGKEQRGDRGVARS